MSCKNETVSIAFGEEKVAEIQKEIQELEEKEDFHTEITTYIPVWGDRFDVVSKQKEKTQPNYPLPKITKISTKGLVQIKIEPEI